MANLARTCGSMRARNLLCRCDMTTNPARALHVAMRGPAVAVSDNPLCIDLDGTLVAADLFWESVLVMLKRHPLRALALISWMLRGRAYAKQEVAQRVAIDATKLPYREEVVSLMRDARRRGRDVVLVTAADQLTARAVARHLGLFTLVLASDGKQNLSGRRKAAHLESLFGRGRFEYAGNSRSDLPVWLAASRAIAVAAPPTVVRRLARQPGDATVLVPSRGIIRPLIRALRPFQWVKNLLVFVPLITSQQLLDVTLLPPTVLTMLAFCLCASGIYVINDLLDIDADRLHPRKRKRPFAAGELSVPAGVLLGIGLVTAALTLTAAAVSAAATAIVALYATVSIAYSLRLKREPVADVFILAGLYIVRIIAGGIAAHIVISTWLLGFGLFLLLSLAFVKRYTELAATTGDMPGRGYTQGDARWMHAVGTSSGYMAVVVLALYVNSPEVTILYRDPSVLWLLCPLLLFWVTRLWFRASRAAMVDDPVLAVVRDPASYVVAAVAAVVLMTAL
jgi:4-hydroxybenzoate polyprenyltransferase/phosphoserine phosphatase